MTPGETLSNATARSFVVIDTTSNNIQRSKIYSKQADIEIFKKHLDTGGIVCDSHDSQFVYRQMSIFCRVSVATVAHLPQIEIMLIP